VWRRRWRLAAGSFRSSSKPDLPRQRGAPGRCGGARVLWSKQGRMVRRNNLDCARPAGVISWQDLSFRTVRGRHLLLIAYRGGGKGTIFVRSPTSNSPIHGSANGGGGGSTLEGAGSGGQYRAISDGRRMHVLSRAMSPSAGRGTGGLEKRFPWALEGKIPVRGRLFRGRARHLIGRPNWREKKPSMRLPRKERKKKETFLDLHRTIDVRLSRGTGVKFTTGERTCPS